MNQMTYKLTIEDINRINAVKKVDQLEINLLRQDVNPVSPVSPLTFPIASMSTWFPKEDVTLPESFASVSTPLQIWTLPNSMTQLPKPNAYEMLPKFKPRYADEKNNNQDIQSHGWITQFSFRVKRPIHQDNAPMAEHTYRILGIDAKDISLVQRWLDDVNDLPILHAAILYSSVSTDSSITSLLESDKQVNVGIILEGLQIENHPAEPLQSKMTGAHFYDGFLSFLEKLLRCTTASEGYLYYYDSENDRGLPEIFKEGQDTAELRLICIHDKDIVHPNRITNMMNGAVTAIAEDIRPKAVFAEAIPIDTVHMPRPTDSLKSIADYYYMEPVQVAEACVEAPLTPYMKLFIPDKGIYEVRGENIMLNDVVSFTSMDPEQIRDLNPEITDWSVALPIGTILLLPHAYIEVGSGAWGNTLQSIGKHFNVEVGCLVQANLYKTGLFSSDSGLNFKAGPVLRSFTDPIGTVSFETERLVPYYVSNIHVMEKDEDGKLYIEQLFHLLRARVRENRFFKESKYTLPISPTSLLSTQKNITKPLKPTIKSPGETWAYKHTIPYFKYTKDSLAPSPNSLIVNPYGGIGGVVQTEFQWLDLFGNILKLNDHKGTFMGPPIRIGYNDPLIPLSQWPSITSTYDVGYGPMLKVDFHFNTKKYEEENGPSNGTVHINDEALPAHRLFAMMDLRVYTRLLEQLCDPAEPENASKNQVKFLVETSLVNQAFEPTLIDLQKLKNWLTTIKQYLQEVADDKPVSTTPNPIFSMSFLFQMDSIRTEWMFELTTTFRMSREASLVVGAYINTASVYDVQTKILPSFAMEIARDSALQQFATSFESALQSFGTNVRVKLAIGQKSQSNSSHGSEALWAVRIDRHQQHGVGFDLLDKPPLIYTPKPLSIQLLPCNMPLFSCKKDGTIQDDGLAKERDLNLDDEMLLVLESLEDMLSPEFSAPARVIEEQCVEEDGFSFVSSITAQKKKLACLLKTLLNLTVKGTGYGEEAKLKAQNDFEQQLLQRLPNFYKINAAIQVETNLVQKLSGDALTPQFYGSYKPLPVQSVPVTLTSSKLPVYTANSSDSPFMTSFFSVNQTTSEEQAALSVIDLSAEYTITHVEHSIRLLSSTDGYRSSSWIRFVLPDQGRSPLWQQYTTRVPIILRSYPPKPILDHRCFPAVLTPETWQDACKYTYEVAIRRDQHPPQDEIKMNIFFNQKITGLSLYERINDFPSALWKFSNVYPELKNLLNRILSPLKETVIVNQSGALKPTIQAMRSYVELVESVITNLEMFLDSNRHTLRHPYADFSFTITEGKATCPDCYILRLQGELSEEIDILLENDSGTDRIEPIEKVIESTNAIEFKYNIDTSLGQKMPKRVVQIKNLPLTQKQSVRSTVSITRNAGLLGTDQEINEAYIYRTPEVGFVTPIGLTAVYHGLIDATEGSDPTNQHSVSDYLNRLFEQLLNNYQNNKALIIVENKYGYDLDNELQTIENAVEHLPEFDLFQDGVLDYSFVTDKLSKGNKAWLELIPHSDKNGYFRFDLTLMSAVAEEPTPLLQLSNIRIPLERILR